MGLLGAGRRLGGRLRRPGAQTLAPLKGVMYLLSVFVPVLSPMHRPRRLFVGWAEYDQAGEEIAFHELVETSVSSIFVLP